MNRSLGRSVSAGAALTTAIVGLVAGTATAAIKDGTCQSGEVCYWEADSFAGGLYDNNDGSDGDLSNNYFIVAPAVTANNAINSIRNLGAGGKSMKLYDGYNGSNFLACSPYGTQYSALGAASNRSSSHYRQSGAGC